MLIAGYFVLDGFDLGIGVLSPFIAKNDEERAVLRRAIGPVWDGNEVWLLTAGGALFAAFPDAYATTFSGFYLAVMLVLFGLIVRAVDARVLVGPEMDPNLGILRWLFAALVVVGLLASLVVGKTSGDDLKAFLAQSASMIALVALLACSMFPVLVNATADSVGPAITLANAASSELSLTWMTIILCIGLPLVLVYHVVIYRTFRGRVNPADLEEY